MAKRPEFDLASLTAGAAEPMQEAAQRVAQRPLRMATPPTSAARDSQPIGKAGRTKTDEAEQLAFKVAPDFRRRFRQRALEADLKLNELLFAALEAWEEKHRLR